MNLIVNFPASRQSKYHDSKKQKKHVCFSDRVQEFDSNCIIEVKEKKSAWYTSGDMKRLRAQFRIDVLKCSSDPKPIHHVVGKTNIATFSNDMVGLERFVNAATYIEHQRKRDQFFHAFFAERDKQQDNGICNPVQMALVLLEHSKWAVARAHQIGVFCAEHEA